MELLEVRPDWREGQRFALEVEEQGDKRNQVVHVELTVEAVDEDGARLRWQPQWAEVFEAPDPELALDAELAEELEAAGFEVALNAEGRLMGISNEIELLGLLDRLIEAILRSFPDSSAREKTREILTPRFLFQKMKRPVDLYFGLCGKTFETGQRRTHEITLPNPVGGGTMKGEVAILAERDFAGRAIVRLESKTPMAAMFQGIAKAAEFEVPADALEAALIDLTEVTLDEGSGAPASVRFTRRCDHPLLRRFDFIEIRLH